LSAKPREKEPSESELDFETIREPWNKYSLMDGSNLKLRFVLLKVKRTVAENKVSYTIKSQTLIEAYNVPNNLRGPKAKAPVPPSELKSAKKQEVGFSTIFEEWCEYMVEDGARIRAKCSLMEVYRTDKANMEGEPIYLTHHSTTVNIKPPKNLVPQKQGEE